MGCYQGNDQYYVAVDCIIFGFDAGELKLLILKRKFQPAKGNWSLTGGFLKQEESLDEGARRILKKLTGLTNIFMEQMQCYSAIDRDPGDRTISVAYFALIKVDDNDRKRAETFGAHWIGVKELPSLIFDHNIMVNKALRTLRHRVSTKPVGFELLPEKFTLPQFQSLYEAIYQEPLEKRNFRKQILQTGLLVKLDEKEKESSKKGAFFYRFNKEMYATFVKRGFHFQMKVKKDSLIKMNAPI